ncbi:TetR/AcrR family transcriptional regulator [Methylobacterium currus]|nr:TetR/AcrR family transcriptional regulator [Methylobacterium currus]
MSSMRRADGDLDRVKDRPGGRSSQIREAVKAAVHEELIATGYAELSYRNIARRAGVDASTLYRRWPTRPRLVADLLLGLSDEFVTIPDTGTLEGDLTDLLQQIVQGLADVRTRKVALSLAIAASDGDEEVTEVMRTFWHHRFAAASVILDRAYDRGEIAGSHPCDLIIENLTTAAWFRAIFSQRPIDKTFVEKRVAATLKLLT